MVSTNFYYSWPGDGIWVKRMIGGVWSAVAYSYEKWGQILYFLFFWQRASAF